MERLRVGWWEARERSDRRSAFTSLFSHAEPHRLPVLGNGRLRQRLTRPTSFVAISSEARLRRVG
jgi:hypothetical protein